MDKRGRKLAFWKKSQEWESWQRAEIRGETTTIEEALGLHCTGEGLDESPPLILGLGHSHSQQKISENCS